MVVVLAGSLAGWKAGFSQQADRFDVHVSRKELLEHLGVRPGDYIDVEMLPSGRVEVSTPKRCGTWSELVGLMKRPGQPTLTIEVMNEIIARGWAGELD